MQLYSPKRGRSKPEAAEQEKLRRLLLAMGAKFWIAGTTRKKGDHPGTMMTPGLPDVPFVFLPRRVGMIDSELRKERFTLYDLLVVEMKSPVEYRKKEHGRSKEQIEFAHYCELAGINYVCGDFDVVVRWFIKHGYLRADQVPHYYSECASSTKRPGTSK